LKKPKNLFALIRVSLLFASIRVSTISIVTTGKKLACNFRGDKRAEKGSRRGRREKRVKKG